MDKIFNEIEEKLKDDENKTVDQNLELKEDEIENIKLTPDEYKLSINKKVKDMDSNELNIYNKLKLKKKQESFINIDKEKKIINNDLFNEDESNEESFIRLESLKIKFPELFENIQYDKQMTKNTLDGKHKLIMKLIEDKHSHHVAFSLFIMMTKASENITGQYLNYDGLNGLTESTCEMKDEITDILKEMIDTGELPVEALTPKMRLAMIMSGCIIKTIEKNNSKNGPAASSEGAEVK